MRRKYIVEVVKNLDMVRIYDADQPDQTCAYCDDVKDAISCIREQAADGKDAMIIVIQKGEVLL